MHLFSVHHWLFLCSTCFLAAHFQPQQKFRLPLAPNSAEHRGSSYERRVWMSGGTDRAMAQPKAHRFSTPYSFLTTSSVCLINAFSHFGLQWRCAGCIQSGSCGKTSINSEVCFPCRAFCSLAVVSRGEMEQSAVKFHFMLCVSIDFFWIFRPNLSLYCLKAKSLLYLCPKKGAEELSILLGVNY